MTCDDVSERLVAFHFGALEAEERREVEAHLIVCPACVAEWLDVKRAIESGPEPQGAKPALRARVRASVARELGVPAAPKPRPRWERPIVFAFAAAAVLAANVTSRALTRGPGAPPYKLVATERG